MPDDAILRVSQLGREQNMPKTLTFADRYGHEFPDIEQEIDDDHMVVIFTNHHIQ